MITKQMVDLLREQLAQQPLGPDDLRRVVGMGELYISRKREAQPGYYFMYSFELGGVLYCFFGKEADAE